MVYMSTAMLSADSDSLPACSSCQWSCCHIWSWGTSLTRPHSTSETAHRPVSCSKTPCVISSEVRHHVSSHLKRDTMGYLRRDTMCQLIWGKTPYIISAEARHHVSSHLRRDTMSHLIWGETPCVISHEARHHVSSHLRRDTMSHLIWGETPCVISSEVRHHVSSHLRWDTMKSYLIRSWTVALITYLVLKCQQGVIICTLDLQASLSVWTLLILQVNDEKKMKKTVYLSCFSYGCITKTGYVDSLFFIVFTSVLEKKMFSPQIAKSFILSYQKSAVFLAFCVFGYPT